MELSLRDLKELLCCAKDNSHSFKIGEAYLIRTVTMYYTGRVKKVTDSDVQRPHGWRILVLLAMLWKRGSFLRLNHIQTMLQLVVEQL